MFFEREERGFSWGSFALGVAAGAAAYFFLDPQRGAARRAMARDRTAAAARGAAEEARRRARRVQDRAHGLAYEAKARAHEGEVPDDVLAERVRAQLGRPVSHPRALEVRASNGIVTLSGPILRGEVDGLVSRVSRVRGVRQVENRLEPHDSADVPSLQG
jgi:osmotically-inducible protein OsmY